MVQNLIFFVDVDNTLLDNDQIKSEIQHSLVATLGQTEAEHFWQHHNLYREHTNLVNFPAIITQYCAEKDADQCSVMLGNIFDSIEFSHALFPDAYQVLAHLRTLGTVCIFSEGDATYQRKKIEKSGITKYTDQVLLYEHKLEHLGEISTQFSNSHLIFIDDKDTTLTTIKQTLPKSTTIVVCQGHYATTTCPIDHHADLAADSIAALLDYTAANFAPQNNTQ